MNLEIEKKAVFQAFCKEKSIVGMAKLLKLEKRQLELLADHPRYKSFPVPKNQNREERLIEDPFLPLKAAQSVLNYYLQAAYYFEKSYASYGFVLNLNDDKDKRNILANARKHIGRPHLLQLDLADFFHYVTIEKVKDIFSQAPFSFGESLTELLSELCTFQGRLPMGAPTSPVLSNFACRALDEALLAMSEAKNWVFTRYADDLSISAKRPFAADEMLEIKLIIKSVGFALNDGKTRMLGPDDEKIVTGILLKGKGQLKPGFLEEIQTDIVSLSHVVELQNLYGEIRTKWVEKQKQQVRGKIAFAGFVLGDRNKTYQSLKDAYYVAITPPQEEFGAMSWRGFHYLG